MFPSPRSFSKFLSLACASLAGTLRQPDWKPFWGDSDGATAVVGKGWSPALVLWVMQSLNSCCALVLPTTAVGRPTDQTRLGRRGEKWRNLKTAQVCFWIGVQPWSFVFAATRPSGVNGHWIQKVAWELLECLPGLVVSSAKWNKPNLSTILFLWASATQLLFSFHRVWLNMTVQVPWCPSHNTMRTMRLRSHSASSLTVSEKCQSVCWSLKVSVTDLG